MYLVSSYLFETQVAPLLIWERLFQIVITTALAFYAYPVLKRIDLLFKPEMPSEVHGELNG
jgi:hypothetical protein